MTIRTLRKPRTAAQPELSLVRCLYEGFAAAKWILPGGAGFGSTRNWKTVLAVALPSFTLTMTLARPVCAAIGCPGKHQRFVPRDGKHPEFQNK